MTRKTMMMRTMMMNNSSARPPRETFESEILNCHLTIFGLDVICDYSRAELKLLLEIRRMCCLLESITTTLTVKPFSWATLF